MSECTHDCGSCTENCADRKNESPFQIKPLRDGCRVGKVYGVVSGKGGVGKSTSVYCIGAGLVMDGRKVLLVDVDPQGDLTKMLGQRRPHDLPYTLSEQMNAVVQNQSGSEHPEILHHPEGFDFVPANRRLSAVEVGLVNVMSRETVLKRYLEDVKGSYDYVLLDCRPSLGMLVINALSASDYVLIPVQAGYLAAEDMTELVGTVQSIRQQINPKLKIEGILLTMTDSRTNYGQQIDNLIRGAYGSKIKVFDQTIPRSVRAAEISAVGKSIFQHDPKGKVAEAYKSLTEEVMANAERQLKRVAERGR